MKGEILKKLTDQGIINNFQSHPAWVEAFEAYKKETGDNQVGYKCSTCYRKVLQWLRK